MSRRLWRPGDAIHPKRAGGKSIPKKGEIPDEYDALIDWYHRTQPGHAHRRVSDDPILKLRGLGKEIWKGVDPDDYVRRLREGWE